MKACILIPFYNHAGAIGQVVESLMPFGLPIRIVDDGSDEDAQRVLASLEERVPQVTVLRLATNQGKGGAVMAAAMPRWPPVSLTHCRSTRTASIVRTTSRVCSMPRAASRMR